MNAKIQKRHLDKPAYVYLRQSSMGQVRYHRESTERQYALRDRARALGWKKHQILVLDGDLGISGTQSQNRGDFKTLIADVSMGKVGAVFSIEASRLSRSNTDWHRLLELCALTATLMIDEDGIYDPTDFNDQLLLGFKGTMSVAELHFIRARLHGGKVNRARKGDLHCPLPVGYVYDDLGKTVQDPDKEVRNSISLVFQAFRQTGSAYGVMTFFRKNSLKFPKRAYGGAWSGKLVWSQLNHARALGVLKNPVYAGAYVYGQYQGEKRIEKDGSIHYHISRRPQEEWQVLIKNHHQGYLEWDEYMKNQDTLKDNQTNKADSMLASPAREGLALLQGLLVCGFCGHRLTVRYMGNKGIYPCYQCNWKKREGFDSKECMTLKCEWVDNSIVTHVLSTITTSQIEVAIQAFEEIEERRNSLKRQWDLRLERAKYEADLAQRRYEQVDPDNRLVAANLETYWNDQLERLEQARKDRDAHLAELSIERVTASRNELIKLGKDFPKLWNHKDTTAKDKKRVLRLLFKDITVERNDNKLTLHLRWQGGALEDLYSDIPKKAPDRWRHPPELIEKVRTLAKKHDDQEIADILNSQDRKTNKGNTFTVDSIKWIRYKFKIPLPTFKRKNELTVREVADEFVVSIYVIYYWIQRNVIKARKRKAGYPWFITLDKPTRKRLQKWVATSGHLIKPRQSQKRVGGGAI